MSRTSTADAAPADDEFVPVSPFLRAWMLLLLFERPSHGYQLIARLRVLGYERERAVYRTLNALQEAGLVRSHWETPDAGPARRVFEITPAGEERLAAVSGSMDEVGRLLGDYRRRYRSAARRQPLWAGIGRRS